MTGDTPLMPTPALLRLAHNVLSAHLFRTIAGSGFGDLRPAHGSVMEQLSFGDGLRLTDLAGRAGITPQSMGELVDDLAELGYVERRPDPADRRAKRVHLTRRGAQNVRTAARVVAGLERELEDVLGADAHAALRRMLEQLLAAYASGR